MSIVDYLDETSEWADTDHWQGIGWYVVDCNGIVAGVFDDEGEAMWWCDKAARI